MLIRRCRGWAGARHLFGARLLGITWINGIADGRVQWVGVTDGMCAECAALMRIEGLRERLAKVERLLDGRSAPRVAAARQP